uniref:NifU domain protein n=1 Tax=uncultured microorganism TaxID=358574 RepID=F8UHQ5_9ZZZZ|nr:NifU domain protein [uncultured microorganism]
MDEDSEMSSNILEASQDDTYFGRMNDASGAAYSKGLCGDEMEFYLIIINNIVTEIKYYTDGCVFTKACGATAARFALKKPIQEVLRISPQQIAEELKYLPQDYLHCSILAVSALHKAIADYLLKP